MRGLRSLCSERGGVLVMVALALPVMLAFAALVIDVGHAYQLRRHLQASADAAALAGAQELPNVSNAHTVANAYDATNGLNERSNLPAVTTVVSFPAPTGAKVKVTESAKSEGFFGGILGFDGFDVSATAVASRASTTAGTPLAVYVHELCGNKGFISGGLNMQIEGGIHSNGHFEVKNEDFQAAGGATVYRPPHANSPSPPGPAQPSSCKTTDVSDSTYAGVVGNPTEGKYRDWVTPYHTEAILKGFVPCTHELTNDVKFENTTIPTGVYCLPPDKKFTIAGNVNGKITVIGGMIEVGGTGKLEPYNTDHPVLFYSTHATDPIKLNPSAAYDWTGYIINRKGGIVINAAGVTSPQKGLLEAEWIEINGENFKMLGTFPDSSQGSSLGAVTLEE
jgi:Flp pilus assembly protein TadG